MSAQFYNTTGESGQQLLQFQAKAESQQDAILQFFKRHAGELFTPSEVNQRVVPDAPIHSVRARITTLEQSGELVKTTVKRTSPHGRPEHCWTYPTDERKAA